MSEIKVTPLGAGQDVGRSCILLSIGNKNIMLDCGMHMGYNDDRRFPDFSYITDDGPLTDYLDCIIITHFHLDHCGALPYMTEMIGYNGPVYMTTPTKAICPILLEDYRKITVDKKGETNFFTSQNIKDCMKKVTTISLHQTINVDDELEIKAYYAGHVLGAAMFQVKVGNLSCVYTGDYNMTPDRHLGAAWIDKCRPNLLITETTYATTIRDSKRCRERDFLLKVHDCVERGGKVLIPVFALGRAQELCILLETYWERMNLKVPIYFALGLTERATNYYKMFITWTNEKIKKTFVQRNMFDFKHIKAFDRAYIDNPNSMVIFATPGMLHAGLSLQLFKKWAPNENNMVIMPGYCVSGTVGHKILGGAKKIEFENKQTIDVRMSVEYMSFSAHADAKGIMQLISQCEPENVLLVHGEASKMEFLQSKVKQEFGINCFMPKNGETVNIPVKLSIPVDIEANLLKRCLIETEDNQDNKKPKILHGTMVISHQGDVISPKITIVESNKLMSEIGIKAHQIQFTTTLKIKDKTKKPVQSSMSIIHQKLKKKFKDYEIMINDNEIAFASVIIKMEMTGDQKLLYISWKNEDELLGSFVLQTIQESTNSLTS